MKGGTKKLTTKRLTLRKFFIKDALCMFNNWASDSLTTKYLTWLPHESVSQTENIIRGWKGQYKNPCFYQWAIVLKDLGEPIGSISVVREKEHGVEVGYCIGSKWWGKGITTEALEKVIEYLLKEEKYQKVYAKHNVLNVASGRVMQKCKMTFIERKEKVAYNGGFYAMDLYEITL